MQGLPPCCDSKRWKRWKWKWLLLVQKTVELLFCHSRIVKRIDKELDR